MPIHTNVDFPAPLVAALFVGLVAGWIVLLTVWFVASWRQMPSLARWTMRLAVGGSILYLGLLYGFSWKSKEKTLARGAEKYFCELDCHLAYSVVDVQQPKAWTAEAGGASASIDRTWDITLRTRFDQSSISKTRGMGLLTPNPRTVEVVGGDGKVFRPAGTRGADLMQPLKPGESYVTHLLFQLPTDVKEPRLLIREGVWMSQVGIGSENSPGHRKTYFQLQ